MMRFKPYHSLIFLYCFVFFLLIPGLPKAEIKTWTGYGGDTNWLNPLNWSGGILPKATDDVLLDNSDLPVSYQVMLPDIAVVIKTILINPSPGRNIEMILPSSNIITNAFTVTGPGYGIELKAGAIFRNASGISSGESLLISDSMIIHDGGRYIHQTRGAHANSILKLLSTAPGTEQGVFDFNVPRASYTISVSNRIYGSLELHADAFGDTVNYTGTGSNGLFIRGNLRIGAHVNVSLDLNGVNGNVQVAGDFLQEGGLLNLASGTGDSSVLRIKGDLYQSPGAVISESSNGNPLIELNGDRLQDIALAGQILNQVGFRMNNIHGSELRMPLELPFKLDLNQGFITSTTDAMLILDSACTIFIDSSRLSGTYINGPLCKRGLDHENHFLFPVGKDDQLRWLELKNAIGNYTVEYFHQNPYSISGTVEPGLDHISKLEYWSVISDGTINKDAKIELSFASSQSGGVTDPAYLQVAEYQTEVWRGAGHSGTTGNSIQGSVISDQTDFSAKEYTLASSVNLENPLPLTAIDMELKKISGQDVFSWTVETSEMADHFDLFEETVGQGSLLKEWKAVAQQKKYSWVCNHSFSKGNHYFRISMTDINGNEYWGNLVLLNNENGGLDLSWISTGNSGNGKILIHAENHARLKYEILTLNGRSIKRGELLLNDGNNYLLFEPELMSNGIFVFRIMDSSGKNYSLLFRSG